MTKTSLKLLSRFNLLSKKQEALLLSFLATVPYSIWGMFINWDYGTNVVIKVAITQSVLSFTVTLTMTRLLQKLFSLFDHRIIRFVCTWLGTVIIINTFVFSAHTLVGTPERLATMAPGIIAGFTYSLMYTIRMSADKNFTEKT